MPIRVNELVSASLKAKKVATEDYTDLKAADALTSAKSYADSTSSNALISAQNYADAVKTAAEDYADSVKTALINNEISKAENKAIIKSLGLVPAYSNANADTISYNSTEDAIELYSSDDSAIGMVYPAFSVTPGMNLTCSVQFKSSVAASSGFYIGICEYDSNLPGGKTHISNDSSNSSSVVQEDTRTLWIGKSNAAITTEWQLGKFTYTPTATAKYASIVILNWFGMGTAKLYTKPLVVDVEGVDVSEEIVSNNDAFAIKLGYSSFEDLETKAAANSTIINGGKINTSLIDVDNLIAKNIAINGEDDATGARLVINNSVIEVYDADNVLRAKLGDLST